MNNKPSGFGLIEVLLIITIITLAAALGWFAYFKDNTTSNQQSLNNNRTTTSDSLSKTTTTNSNLKSILQNIDYEILDSTRGGACSINRFCYSGNVYFVKLKYPVTPTFKKIVENLDKNRWLAEDSQPVGSTLNRYTQDLLKNPPKDDKNLYIYSSISNGLGDHVTANRGNEGIFLYPFAKEAHQSYEDQIYTLKSELSINEDNYDFGKLLSKIDDKSYILSITIGENIDK